MYEELLIGFDCREMSDPRAEIANWTHDKSGLLNPNAIRILTISELEWRSVFLRYEEIPPPFGKGPAFMGNHDAIPLGYATPHGYWYDLGDLLEFLDAHREAYQKPCWVIAASVVQTPEAIVEAQRDLSALAPIAEDARPDPEWQL